MKFAAIADWAEQDEYPVLFMCEQLGVSRSGYYAWRSAAPSAREVTDAYLIEVITDAYHQARGNPGVRRMRAELAARGHRLSHRRTWRLMRAAGLQGRHPRAWRRTTLPGEEKAAPAPDLIGRDFTADTPNSRWCGDITYVKTWDGWAYLATVIDLYSRKLVGWAIADHMRTSLVTDALQKALDDRQPSGEVIFHSDRGSVYTSGEFARYCTTNNIRRSLGKTGVCYDNAVSESFFATYKKELIHTRPWPDLKRLRQDSEGWFINYYNTIRRHSTLGYLTPEEYELGYRSIHELAA